MTETPGTEIPFTVTGKSSTKDDPRAGSWTHSIKVIGEQTVSMPAGNYQAIVIQDTEQGTRNLIPDDLFGIEYVGERPYYRLFAVECDRGNEPYERANLDETSLHAKFLRYQKVIGGREYQAHLGRKCGMLVLFVFTTTSKMQGFLERVTEWNGAPCPWILAKTVPCFGKRLSVPPVMRELLTAPWLRAGYAPIDISKPN
jgi:hypothetical protein